MQSNHIKPEVNYREFRIHKLNTPEFSHVRLLLYWPIFGLLFLFLERLQPQRNYYPVYCGLDDNRLDEQIRQAVLSLETKWTEKEIGFQVELEEVKYTANEGLFMHIWINLLDNAIKFSPSKGTITMFLKQEQDSVKFILEDEGPGIEDDVKSRIFDKFYQVDGSHKAEGNGLGLALVKRIVDSAGGTIKA